MSITLDAIGLPDDLSWSDEFDWTPVVQSQSRTEGGALVLEQSERVAGRPITLEGSETAAWSTRGVVKQLYATQQDASGDEMTLTINGIAYQVKWLRDGGTPPMTARPAVRPGVSAPDDDEPYYFTLRFITV